MNTEQIVLVGIGSVLLVFLGWSAVAYFSEDARLDRRRRKNNSKVISRAGRPIVKLSARIKDEPHKTRK